MRQIETSSSPVKKLYMAHDADWYNGLEKQRKEQAVLQKWSAMFLSKVVNLTWSIT